jgi:arylsulfatase A-like enzyme
MAQRSAMFTSFYPRRQVLAATASLALALLAGRAQAVVAQGVRPQAAAVQAPGSLATRTAPASAPNFVVLVADDWGFTDVGAFGGEIATPHIDALARRGVRFSNFHVTASCSPTRAMLLTGVDNHRNGVGNMPETMPAVHDGKPGYGGVLGDQAVTVATMLRDNGYHTYITGKWHLGKTESTLPPRRGFERSFIQADSGSDNWENKPYMFFYDKAYWFDQGQPARMPKTFYSSELIVDKALGYIAADRADGKPFFAYLGFQANHIPLQAPAATIAKYKGRYAAGWSALREARRARAIALGIIPAATPMASMAGSADWDALSPQRREVEQRRMEVYAAMADAMDQQVGKLVDALKRSGQFARTVFVFLSDNGAEPTEPNDIAAIRAWLLFNYSQDLERLGGRGAFASIGPNWASAAVAPLSGYKFFAGEGGLRTPLIVAGAAGLRANHIVPAFTHVTDIVPTLLELAGIAAHGGTYQGRPVEPMVGRSLLPVMQGKAGLVHAANQAIGYELSGNAALFKGPYKLMRNLVPGGDGKWRLYDIERDPGETHDLAAELPSLFAAMQADYAAYALKNGVLTMPEGYDYKVQGQLYAVHHVLVPKLRAAAPTAIAAVLALIGVLWWWRRQRQRRKQ